jgi:methylglutaconyl-CoA hydratase
MAAATEEPLVHVERSGPVGTLRLNRPQRGNSLTPAMVELLKQGLRALEDDKQIRVIVLTGNGKFFCTGMDLASSNTSAMEERSKGKGVEQAMEVYDLLHRCSKPTIAKINGPAMGGGWGLIFACDFRIAVSSAHFSLTEVKRGILPAIISLVIVPQTGPFIARNLMLSGARLTAARALELHLLSRVVSEGELDVATQELVGELLSCGPGAMAKIKRLIDHVATHDPASSREYVGAAFKEMMSSEEAAFGMRAFLQRQQPDWGAFLTARL